VIRGAAAVALALALSVPALAQRPGALVRGVVVRAAPDATPAQLVVRLDDGVEAEVNLTAGARAVFAPGLWTFDTRPLVEDVRPGMTVELTWDAERVDRVRVTAVPPGTRAGVPSEPPAETWGGVKPRPAQDARRTTRQVLYGTLVRAESDAVSVEVDGRRYRYGTAGRDLARGLRVGARIRLEVEADTDGRPVRLTRIF
jgi:hypothetical protein